jgi:formylglycine-generating enzyme required for sulfatase activity
LAEQFEAAWRASGPANLSVFLRPADPTLRLPLLHELIKTDLEMRCRSNCPLRLEDYLEQFPELGPARALPPELIYEEYRVRQLYGDRPGLPAYRDRFPAQFEHLQRLVAQQPFGTLSTEPVGPKPTAPSNRTLVPQATLSAGPPGPPPVPRTADLPGPQAGSPAGRSSAAGDRRVLPVGAGYTLRERIGVGQNGEVFRAVAPGGVEVAVKRLFRPLDDESSKREQSALELIKSLRHTYLLQTHAYWVEEERLHIVTELADGSLDDWFEECRRAGLPGIPADELLAYFAEAAEALDFLHSQRVLHRDVKPANLLRVEGHAKVADFGLARLFEGTVSAGTFCGTPLYMPPETWKGQVSVHSDQYSLAATYAEMCLGRRVYPGRDVPTIGQQHAESAPELDGFSAAEQRVLLKALAKCPDQRYPSCLEFVRALARAHAPPVPAPAEAHRSPWPAVLTAVLLTSLIALAAVVGWRLFVRPGPPPPARIAFCPEGFEPAEPLPPGQRYHKRLLYRLGEGVDPLEFLLISREKVGVDPPTFYILRCKVTNEQFRAALSLPGMHGRPAMQALLEKEAGAHPWTVQDPWLRPAFAARVAGVSAGPFGPGGPLLGAATLAARSRGRWEAARDPPARKHPVRGVTVVEAHCFAAMLGGMLPSGTQWDKAGGRFDGAKGPFKPDWKPDGCLALRLLKPHPVGTCPEDESVFHCRDMATNGREFTCDVRGGQLRVPLADPQEKEDYVDLRGKAFGSFDPFTFESLTLGGLPSAEQQEYGRPDEDIGFRVVIEVPPDEQP